MDITPIIDPKLNLITGYGKYGFTINNNIYSSAIICLPQQIFPLNIANIEEINQYNIEPILIGKSNIDLLIIGYGNSYITPSVHLKNILLSHNINYELMNLGAACRTYNVLISEGRKIACLLIPII